MDARPYDVLLVGESNVDIIVTGDVAPEFGQVEKLVDDIQVCAGASSGIFAAGAARMGLRVLFSSVVGDDLFGHFMRQALESAGVDTTHVRVDPAIKTGAGVLLSKGQDRAILTYLGSIAALDASHVDSAWYHQARHLHIASPFLLSGLRPAMPAMMRAAHAAGMTVSLDTNWDPSGAWHVEELLEHLDVFLPNENELGAITGERDLERGIAAMLERVPLLVVKRGEMGAIGARSAAQGGERSSVAAFPVQVADTTGAGDTFDAGFLAGWLRGASLHRCLLLGAVCGSLTTTQVGGFNGQPTWEEAQEYLRRCGYG